MQYRNRFCRFAALALLGLALAACASLKEPAEKAVGDVETALNAISGEAAKYAPDQYAAVQAKLADLKAALAKADYKAVISSAPIVLGNVNGLKAAISAKKDEIVKNMTGDWTQLAASVPQLLAAVQDRVTTLGKSKKLPAGVDVETAKVHLSDATSLWSKAQAAFANGNVEEAVDAAKEVKAKAENAASSLKMAVPQAAPTPAAK